MRIVHHSSEPEFFTHCYSCNKRIKSIDAFADLDSTAFVYYCHTCAWNKQYPPGTEVILTNDFGLSEKTRTRSIAWDLGDGTPVVKVAGRTGGYFLQRIRPVDES